MHELQINKTTGLDTHNRPK